MDSAIINKSINNSPREEKSLDPPVSDNEVIAVDDKIVSPEPGSYSHSEEMLNDGLTAADLAYFNKTYKIVSLVKFDRIHCTCCNKHIGTAVDTKKPRYKHPLLKVVICEECYLFYCSGDFEKDKDGSELYCRWCGEGGQVFCCTKCPYVFCKRCITRNLGRGTATVIENSDDWMCFSCNPCQINKQRAMCWAMEKYSEYMKKNADSNEEIQFQLSIDFSICCKKKSLPRNSTGEQPRKKIKLNSSIVRVQNSPKQYPSAQFPSSQFEWKDPSAPEDEVICTPDILPFDDSPPSSPPPLNIISPPPMNIISSPNITVTGLSQKKNMPITTHSSKVSKISTRNSMLKPKALNKLLPSTSQNASIQVVRKTPGNIKCSPVVLNTSTLTPLTGNSIKRYSHIQPKPNNEYVPASHSPSTSYQIPVRTKVALPVQRSNANFEDQWFGGAVISSADVTEYISSKISNLAVLHNKGNLTEQKKEEIFNTFLAHINGAIEKLNKIKYKMQSSYNYEKQNNAKKKRLFNPYSSTSGPNVNNDAPAHSTEENVVAKLKKGSRKRSYTVDEENSSDQDEFDVEAANDSDDEYSSESFKTYKKRKSGTKTKRKKSPVKEILLDVIDISDDNMEKNCSDDEMEEPAEIGPNMNIIVANSSADEYILPEREEDFLFHQNDDDPTEILPDIVNVDMYKTESPVNSKTEPDILEEHLTKEKVGELKVTPDGEVKGLSEEELKIFKSAKVLIESNKKPVNKLKINNGETNDDNSIHGDTSNDVSECSDEELKNMEDIEDSDEDTIECLKKSNENADVLDENIKNTLEDSEVSNDNINNTFEDAEVSDENIENTPEDAIVSDKNIKKTPEEVEVSDENIQNTPENVSGENLKNKAENSEGPNEDIHNTPEDTEYRCEESDVSDDEIMNKSDSVKNTDEDITNNAEYDENVDDKMRKNTDDAVNDDDIKEKECSSDENIMNQDIEDILAGSIVVRYADKSNFDAEFSKFVDSNKNCGSDVEEDDHINIDKELEMASAEVSKICQEDNEALSLPPQTMIDFSLANENEDESNDSVKQENNGVSLNIPGDKLKSAVSKNKESELCALRQIAENCIAE